MSRLCRCFEFLLVSSKLGLLRMQSFAKILCTYNSSYTKNVAECKGRAAVFKGIAIWQFLQKLHQGSVNWDLLWFGCHLIN